MNQDTNNPRRGWSLKKTLLLSMLVIVLAIVFFLYNNFNQLLSEALLRSFNSNIASDVYELKFEKLRLNLFERSIRVFNVSLEPRDKPLNNYPYINSSFRLKTEMLMLMKVEVFSLLNSNDLVVERISITKPEIQLLLAGEKHVMFPFRDTTGVTTKAGGTRKRAIESYALKEFHLDNVSFRVINAAKQRQFRISNLDLTLNNLLISQLPGKDSLVFSHVDLGIGEFAGTLGKGAIKHVGFKNFKIGVESLRVQKSVDTLTFHFNDFSAGFADLDVHTADSIFHLTLQSLDLSYKAKSISLGELSFKPNISDAAMQRRYKYQHTQVSATVRSINVNGINFDSLVYSRRLAIDEVVIDKPDVSIFKDNTKPVNKDRIPQYFGQQINAIRMPLLIKRVRATRLNLVNVERKRDSSYARVAIRRGTADVRNISNLGKDRPLSLIADAYIEDKVHFGIRLDFSYRQPEFTLNGKLEKFSLPDLNPVIQAYTPAKINAGIADEIAFTGTVKWTESSGTMKFLYHDLKVDLELKEQAKWKSSVIAFAANSIVNASNPGTADLPPRTVSFHAQRDMNKGFINLIIKSALNGVKETMIMSKENRKTYQAAKKQAKKARSD